MKSLNRYRILYAEDNEDSRDVVSVMCEVLAIEVITAQTVAGAWRLAQSEPFDLYLLDSRFPDGDGLELSQRLRQFAPHTPILIYSGNAYEADNLNGLAAGANEYLTKPYLADLAVTIRETSNKPQYRCDKPTSGLTTVAPHVNSSIQRCLFPLPIFTKH